ncbi:kinase [Longispora fulva]|uniref:Uncharacterized protein involved in propanediol utilization n=1 Tax=Longispora fulva TaxID=619741 RepID=A0A8J7GBN3_9ACTN|nr:hypothetical protein [Longispora fulva]MBG6135595.1 uncharacterized protein involved in propanediol utilization [Longispora fulva]GIG56166.1 kinase [Longispora fulva]
MTQRALHELRSTKVSAEFGIGKGYAPAHHGELLQGMFRDASGGLRRALVTLPQTTRGTRAVFRPSQNHWGVVGSPGLTKVRRAAVLALREFAGRPGAAKGGHIEIVSDVPVGIGMGSSTSDVTAAIRAVADYHGVTLSREELGRLAVLAECASDPVMIDDRVVLFAHRDGVVLETLGHRLPPLLVVGCDTRPGDSVDTDRFPPAEYGDREIGFFGVLLAALRRALATEDVALLGRVATASARINQRFLPKDNLEALLELCLAHGGAGIQIAHSGTVAGLIFDARSPDAPDAAVRCSARIEAMGLVLTTVIGAPPGGTAEERTAC